MKISLLTLGCKVNQAETSVMERDLKSKGFKLVGLDGSPELCIINTCAVTAKSDYQSRQLIRRAYRAGARVIVTGCYSELNRDSVRAMPEVEDVIPNKEKYNYINGLVRGNEGITLDYSGNRSRFFLKVQDGCNSRCSYCVIPMARGRSRSVELNSVLKDVNKAVKSGYKEVVLTGIHIGIYGKDISPKMTLSGLIEEILDKTLIERLRVSSIEIKELNNRLISLFNEQRLCRHLHIPLQSGDNKVLMLMNRNYTVEYYKNRIMELTNQFPDIAIGTDVIIGFPQEGEEEFMNTFNLIESLPFSYIHVFPFSKRRGTPGFQMPDNIKIDEKKKRCSLLRGLGLKKKTDYMCRHIGKTLNIIIEERVSSGLYKGTSSNYLKVMVAQNGLSSGSLVSVKIAGQRDGVLFGKPLN